MADFAFTTPGRIIFGRGTRHTAAAEICTFGQRVLLVRGRSVKWVDDLCSDLHEQGRHIETVLSKGEPDIPALTEAIRTARTFAPDCIVAVGGGAAIDLGKALSGLIPSEGRPEDYLEIGPDKALTLDAPLPFIAIPTTAGTGAEATRNAVIGVPERQAKISLRDPRLVPDLALIDPALTDAAPAAVTLATGLDAITQLIESYLCNRANPLTDALCRSEIPGAVAALSKLMQGEHAGARDAMARASFLSGIALANSGLGVVHGLASVIGAHGAPHGAICGRLLAEALEVNSTAIKSAGENPARIAEVGAWLSDGLGATDVAGIKALRSFTDGNALPRLRDMGLAEDQLADIAMRGLNASSNKANPVALSQDEVMHILKSAF